MYYCIILFIWNSIALLDYMCMYTYVCHYYLHLKLNMICHAHIRKSSQQQNSEENICHCIQWNKRDPGHNFLGNESWNIGQKHLLGRFWNTANAKKANCKTFCVTQKRKKRKTIAKLFALNENAKKNTNATWEVQGS